MKFGTYIFTCEGALLKKFLRSDVDEQSYKSRSEWPGNSLRPIVHYGCKVSYEIETK